MSNAGVPPSAGRVAGRALILSAIVCRSTIDDESGSETEALRRGLLEWLGDLGIATELEATEAELLRAPLGTLTSEQRIAGALRSESLAVLGWALGRCDLPAYDVQADPFAVAQALGFHHRRERTALGEPCLRPRDELAALADRLSSLRQRLRDYSQTGTSIDFTAAAVRVGLRLADGDLEVRGTRLSETPEFVWRTILAITREREQTANWLVGRNAATST